MSTKYQTLTILQQMEEGTREIYSQYEKLMQNAKADYDRRKEEILSEHTAAANAASARAKIDLKNTLEKMADSGYVRSGETVQATIAHNAAKNQALSHLDAQKAGALSDLEGQRIETETDLLIRAQNQVRSYREKMLEKQQKKEEADRKYQLEAAKAAAKTAAKTEEAEGIELKKSATDYVEAMVKKYTRKNTKKGYSYVDRKALLEALTPVIRDETLSFRYRYEMYLYAKSLGYIEE